MDYVDRLELLADKQLDNMEKMSMYAKRMGAYKTGLMEAEAKKIESVGKRTVDEAVSYIKQQIVRTFLDYRDVRENYVAIDQKFQEMGF